MHSIKKEKSFSQNQKDDKIQFNNYEFMSLTLMKHRGKYLTTSDLKVKQKWFNIEEEM